MIICLLLLSFCELLLLTGSIIAVASNQQRNAFQFVMSIVLSTIYLFLMVIYIPLFSTILERLRVAFPAAYTKLKRMITVGFIAFMLLMLLRYMIYLCFQFDKFQLFKISAPRAYIVFYISEIIISVSYITFLVRVYRSKVIEIENERSHSSVQVDDHQQGSQL